MRMKTFISNYSNPALARAVIRQFGGWEAFKEKAQDVANHGISGGFHGFVYYTDTVPFGFKHRDAILKQWQEQATECGTNLLNDIAKNRFVKDSQDYVLRAITCTKRNAFEYTDVYNLLSWVAAEDVARAYMYAMED